MKESEKQVFVDNEDGFGQLIVSPLTQVLNELQTKGFPVGSVTTEYVPDTHQILISYSTQDEKIHHTVEDTVLSATNLKDLKLAEKLRQDFGGEIMMTCGSEHFAAPKITFEVVEERVNDLVQHSFERELNSNSWIAPILSNLRALINND